MVVGHGLIAVPIRICEFAYCHFLCCMLLYGIEQEKDQRMKLNRIPAIDLSTGHLTVHTRDWMSRKADEGRLGFMERDEGFFLSTTHARDEDFTAQEDPQLPPDLHLCLSMAAANDVQYVLFDRDADAQPGLPFYEERMETYVDNGATYPVQPLDADHDFDGIAGLDPSLQTWTDDAGVRRAVYGYAPRSLQRSQLRIEENGPVLEDGEYEVDGGCWLTLGNASIRVCEPENDPGVLRISVLPKGMEDVGPEFGALDILQEDLAEEIENNRREQEADETPSI